MITEISGSYGLTVIGMVKVKQKYFCRVVFVAVHEL